jgi:uncharacterized protein (DUF305 family)
MKHKTLIALVIGVIVGAGGMLAVAQLSKDDSPARQPAKSANDGYSMTMESMTAALKDKSGDDFDKEFLTQMIAHHQGAIDMAYLADTRAKHSEVKELSADIIAAQIEEIARMKSWYAAWGYRAEDLKSSPHEAH